MKKVLVTGVGGFAGGHIANYLHKNGFQVSGIVRKKKDFFDFPVIEQDLTSIFDLSGNYDAIVHAAGRLPGSSIDFNLFKRDNIDSMVNLIKLAKRKKIKKFIYLSTIGVHGEFRESIINEKSDMINPDFYGITKYMAELLLRAESSIQSISLRMPGIVGKGAKNVWLSNLIEKFKNNEEIKIYSPEFETKNFIHVFDLARFIELLLIKKRYEDNVVMLGCKRGIKIKDIIARIKIITKSQSNVIIVDSSKNSFCIDHTNAIKNGYKSMLPEDLIDLYCTEMECF